MEKSTTWKTALAPFIPLYSAVLFAGFTLGRMSIPVPVPQKQSMENVNMGWRVGGDVWVGVFVGGWNVGFLLFFSVCLLGCRLLTFTFSFFLFLFSWYVPLGKGGGDVFCLLEEVKKVLLTRGCWLGGVLGAIFMLLACLESSYNTFVERVREEREAELR
jgi:hypothetical protein